ncbi:hypothetical protein [Acidisphaera sp. S103]|uniref:hypothetical protein n=1 Tax=Acidisphaera sp. S103 TaxID=1747223 RepID=UPI001C2047A9|nr:hypothetical protein [Acidisphaera sp. S103]
MVSSLPEPTTVSPVPGGTVEQTPDERATLANEILTRMSDMHSHYDIDARDGGFALVRRFEIDDQMLGEYGLPSDGEQIFRRTETLPEMHETIITQEGPHYAPELVGHMPAQTATLEAEPRPPLPEGQDYNFRPLASIEASIGEHLARAVDIVLGETMAVLVPDPGVTPEQARDLNRAYEEKLEARAVEGARLDDAAALDAVNTGIAHNQPRDMPGAEVKLSETVYDRYPGLTRERFGDVDSLQRERTSDFEIGDGFGMKL